MNEKQLNWSLFLRALYGMVELLDRLYLEPYANEFKRDFVSEEKLRRGVAKYRDTLTAISKNHQYKFGRQYKVVYPIHKEGNA